MHPFKKYFKAFGPAQPLEQSWFSQVYIVKDEKNTKPFF